MRSTDSSLQGSKYYPIISIPVAVNSTDHEESPVTKKDNFTEHPVCCKVAKMLEMPGIFQEPVLVRVQAIEHQVVQTHPRLMRRGLWKTMVARDLCDVTTNHPLTLLAAILSKTAMTLPKHMNIAQCA